MPKVLLQTGLQIIGNDSQLGNTLERLDNKFEKLERSFKRTSRLSREIRAIGGVAASLGIANALGFSNDVAENKKQKEAERALRISKAPSAIASYQKDGEVSDKFSEVGGFIGSITGQMFGEQILGRGLKAVGSVAARIGASRIGGAIGSIGASLVGRGLGALAGGFLGSALPVVGTIAGALVGQYIGEKLGNAIGSAIPTAKEYNFKEASLKSVVEMQPQYVQYGYGAALNEVAFGGFFGTDWRNATNANNALYEKRGEYNKAQWDALADQRRAIEWLVRE